MEVTKKYVLQDCLAQTQNELILYGTNFGHLPKPEHEKYWRLLKEKEAVVNEWISEFTQIEAVGSDTADNMLYFNNDDITSAGMFNIICSYANSIMPWEWSCIHTTKAYQKVDLLHSKQSDWRPVVLLEQNVVGLKLKLFLEIKNNQGQNVPDKIELGECTTLDRNIDLYICLGKLVGVLTYAMERFLIKNYFLLAKE